MKKPEIKPVLFDNSKGEIFPSKKVTPILPALNKTTILFDNQPVKKSETVLKPTTIVTNPIINQIDNSTSKQIDAPKPAINMFDQTQPARQIPSLLKPQTTTLNFSNKNKN